MLDGIHTNSGPCLVNTGIQTIGAYPARTAGFFNGYIDQLQILLGTAKTNQQILDDATLVAKYTMDCLSYENWDSGPNHITGFANALLSGHGGRVGQSYIFNNTSAYFQATGFVLLGESYSDYSFALWVRPIISVTTGGTILHVSSSTTGVGWCVPFIGLGSSGQVIINGYSGAIIAVIGPVLTVGKWVHLVYTYSTVNGMRLYVDGSLYGQSSVFTYLSHGSPMVVTLGQSLSGNTCAHSGIIPGNFRGSIDEFYIYSRELAQSDVTALANP